MAQASHLELSSSKFRQGDVLAKLDAMAAPLRQIREAGRSGFLLINHEADRKIREEFSTEMSAALGSYHELVGQLGAGPQPTVSSGVIFLKIQTLLNGYERHLMNIREAQLSQLRWTARIGAGLIVLFVFLTYYWFKRFKKFKNNRAADLQRAVDQQTVELKEREQALKAQAEFLKLIYQGSRDAIATIDARTKRFSSCNAAALELFGIPTEAEFCAQLPGALSPEYQPDGQRSEERSTQIITQAFKEGSLTFGWLWKKRDGTTFSGLTTLDRLQEGGQSFLLGTLRDLTAKHERDRQRKAYEEQLLSAAHSLATSEAHYRALYEHSSDAIGTIDPSTTRYLSCNRAALTLFGVSSEADFLALNPGQLSPPFQPDGHRSSLKATNLYKQLLTQAYYSGEWLFRRLDGREFLALLTFAQVHAGEKVFILATVRDLTLQKLAEKNLQLQATDMQQLAQNRHEQFRLSENRYRSLVDASPDAILVVTQAGQIELVNPAATLFFGYAPTEIIGQPIEQFIPTLLAKVQAAFRAQYLSAPTLRPMGQGFIEVHGRRNDGSEFPAEVILSSMESPDGKQVICVVRHISATKQAALQMAILLEKEKGISQMKTQFISLTSHEFRTPMAAAMGSAEILAHHLDQLDPAKRQALLGRITTSLQHMNRMLDDILLLNRIDASRVDLRLRSVDLAQELQSILHEIELGDRGQHTFHFAPTTADPAFVSDPSLLQHIFSNLLSNAVRYSPAGTVITLRLNFTVDAAIVEVEDQGIGIPLADQARIFEPFERGSNIGQIAGTGLGLNIVQRMAGLMHGTVAMSSIATGGTNFTIVLPRMTAPQP